MTPIPSSSLSKPNGLSSLLEKSPKDLQYRAVPKALNEEIIASACRQLSQLKAYPAEFTLIEKAIEQIPQDLDRLNVVNAIKVFNNVIAGYKQVIDPFPIISCIAEVQALEQQLEDHSLQQLWDALWFDALLDVVAEPQLETIEQKRKWFEDEQNRSLLKKVVILNLSKRKIVRLPREIFKLLNLEELDLSENLIEVFPESVKVWKKLVKLDLFDNKLKYLPRGIKYLKRIEELNLSANEITNLSYTIKFLKALEELNVEANYLERLPKEIGECTSLISLKVSKNQIVDLPIEMQNLSSLKVFSAAGNQLRTVPKELCSWKQIEEVDLSDNPLGKDIAVDLIKTVWPSAKR